MSTTDLPPRALAKPIACFTHPRACSTAFERALMNHKDVHTVFHEPFGDCFYYGSERVNFEKNDSMASGKGVTIRTWKGLIDEILAKNEEALAQGKRVFLKDIARYISPPHGVTPEFPLSFGSVPPEPTNPTLFPSSSLSLFHFTFLIRHPRLAVPSSYRICSPPMDQRHNAKWEYEVPSYDFLRNLFDYLRSIGQIGPEIAGHARKQAGPVGPEEEEEDTNAANVLLKDGKVNITLIDAEDLMEDPLRMMQAYCREVGLGYYEEMLHWGDKEGQRRAAEMFRKFDGWHDEALESSGFRSPKKEQIMPKTREEEDSEWEARWGEEGRKEIRKRVDECLGDYLYLKQFALKL